MSIYESQREKSVMVARSRQQKHTYYSKMMKYDQVYFVLAGKLEYGDNERAATRFSQKQQEKYDKYNMEQLFD